MVKKTGLKSRCGLKSTEKRILAVRSGTATYWCPKDYVPTGKQRLMRYSSPLASQIRAGRALRRAASPAAAAARPRSYAEQVAISYSAPRELTQVRLAPPVKRSVKRTRTAAQEQLAYMARANRGAARCVNNSYLKGACSIDRVKPRSTLSKCCRSKAVARPRARKPARKLSQTAANIAARARRAAKKVGTYSRRVSFDDKPLLSSAQRRRLVQRRRAAGR